MEVEGPEYFLPAGVAGHGAVVVDVSRPCPTDPAGEAERPGTVLDSHHVLLEHYTVS